MIEVRLSASDVRLAEKQAAACAIGGKSNVRGADRAEALYDDQLIGQLGTIALHRYWFGNLERYIVGRYYQNRTPLEGDRGEDIPGANVDVKCSRMRVNQDPWSYHLVVRPRERYQDWVYVLGLLPANTNDVVYLMGWSPTERFPTEPRTNGVFDGAYVLNSKELLPLPPVRYEFLPKV